MSPLKARLLFKADAQLAEGPAWDARIQKLWWVDILGSKLMRFNPASGENEAFDVGAAVGAVVPEEGGEVLLALKHGFARFNKGQVSILTSMDGPEDIRFNDGKCDPQGRFWAGTMSMDQAPGAGNLVCLERDLSVSRKIKGVTVSNGLAWSPDQKKMYYIDSPTQRVMAFDFESSSGGLSNPRVAVEIAAEEGIPDGMTVDSEGMLWIALYNGSKVIRVDPKSGARLGEITIEGAAQVTSCTFGGKDLGTLYITTAPGKLFCAEPGSGIQGLATHTFKAS